jgi:DNA-binding CsgD family transcriptional regulator/tetratricopeptide (TPR) repeat protein
MPGADNDRVLSAHGRPRRFVGRAAELERLEVALEAAGSGRGSVVLVGGEAGIGKTRLAAELADRAHRAGAAVLTGHCIDLVGTGLPYLAILDALRPLRGSPACTDLPELSRLAGPGERSNNQPPRDQGGPDRQVRLFEEVRVLLDRLAVDAPVVLVLEDLHWADASTLDLLSYLAYGITGSRILIVATYRDDEVRAGDPLPRLVTGLVRAGRAGAVHLGPLAHDELTAVLRDVAERTLPADLTETIVERSGGSPFFAEELLSAATRGEGTLPPLLRDTLLHRVAPLGADVRVVLRVAAAARRDVPYGLLAAVVPLAEHQLRDVLRQAVEHRILVADQTAGTFRFRHALLAEAMYATLIPGEREDLHARLAHALGEHRASAGELAPHWTAAGRPIEALAASMRAARDAEAVSGRTEALAHLETALALWPVVPEADEQAGMDLSAVLTWAAELAYLTGNGPRAAAHTRRALELLDERDEPVGAAVLYERLGTYLLPTGDRDNALAAFARAVDLVPTEPPSEHRVRVLAAHGNALMVATRYAESQLACEEAIAVAATVADLPPPVRALDVRALSLCYLGHTDEALTLLGQACQREHDTGEPPDLVRPYVFLSDALNLVGRLPDAARVARDGLALARRLGTERGIGNVLASNAAEALLGMGDWAGADDVLTTVLRWSGFSWRKHPHRWLAQLAIGRGDFDAARGHLDAGAPAEREPATTPFYHCLAAELALWEGRPTDAAAAVDDGRQVATSPDPTRFRSHLCALGVRAQAERARLAAVRSAATIVDDARRQARRLLDEAQDSVREAAVVSPDAAAWIAVAEAEHSRVEGRAEPDLWLAALNAWDRLNRPYPTAYCRWRYVEALLSNGSPTAAALTPAREAYRIALKLGARPLRRELELLAQRARLDLAGLQPARSPDPYPGLGLSPREQQVLGLLAHGYTNRQIATQLTISAKTASVHVSHILDKLGVSHRIDAAEIAQKLHPPGTRVGGSGNRNGGSGS